MHKVFIDGQAGTTGLLIHDRLKQREDIQLLEIEHQQRKDLSAKRDIMETADVVILCLPDDAARETVKLSNKVRFIDASTAHRTDPNWIYGLPELNASQRDQIRNARMVSNPGCYPTGFLAGISPLIEKGLLKKSALLSINAISGYSGGGRNMIESYEQRSADAPDSLWYSRPYALHLSHKHVPEMMAISGLDTAPLFMPSVGHYERGMLVNVGIFPDFCEGELSPERVQTILAEHFAEEAAVTVYPSNDESQLDNGFLDPQGCNHTNRIELFVFGKAEQILVTARLDNLGKGASAAAVQNLNLMLGVNELEGLVI